MRCSIFPGTRLAPVLCQHIGRAEQHGTGRTQAQQHADQESGQHTKQLAMRIARALLQRLAQHVMVWQGHDIHLLPVSQPLARLLLLPHVECIADACQGLAERAIRQADMQHGHQPRQGQQPAHRIQQVVQQRRQPCRQQHGQRPGQPALASLRQGQTVRHAIRQPQITAQHRLAQR